jgi:transcriptional regulator with XRE-family HTH domain
MNPSFWSAVHRDRVKCHFEPPNINESNVADIQLLVMLVKRLLGGACKMTFDDLAKELACLMAGKRKHPDDAETFGQRLARLRKARGYTQTELGDLIGLSQRLMTYYERENGRPPGHLLPRLAEILGVSVDVLLGVEAVREPPPPKHTRLWRKLREIEKLPEADRKAVLRFVDALVTKQRLQQKHA